MPRILLLPNGGGEPNLIQLTMWPSILEKIGATVILAEAPSKRRGLSKKKKKKNVTAAHQTFDIVVSSYSSLEKSQSKLTEFGLNYYNAVFVSGKEWWKTKNMKDPFVMTPKPSTTTTTITKSSSTTASSSSSTSSSSTSGLKRSRDEKAHISQKKSKPTSSAGLQMLAPPIDNRCSQSNSTNNNFVILVYVKVDEECSTFIDACTSKSPEINGTLQQVGTRHFTVVKGISFAHANLLATQGLLACHSSSCGTGTTGVSQLLPATVEVDNWKRWGAGLYATPTATGKRELGRLLNWLSGLSFIASKQITPQDNLHMSLYRRRKGCDTETFKDGIARIRSDPTCKPRGRVRVLSIVLKELGVDYSNAVVLAH
jgi:hypothetical protein